MNMDIVAKNPCQHRLCRIQHVQSLAWDKGRVFQCQMSTKEKNKREHEEVESLELAIKRAEVEHRRERMERERDPLAGSGHASRLCRAWYNPRRILDRRVDDDIDLTPTPCNP